MGKHKSGKKARKNGKAIEKQYIKQKWEQKQNCFCVSRCFLFYTPFFSLVKMWLSKIQNIK